jgi:hypothetical protein
MNLQTTYGTLLAPLKSDTLAVCLSTRKARCVFWGVPGWGVPASGKAGVNRVLERPTKRRERRRRETKWNGSRTSLSCSKDKGIAQVINNLNNPPVNAWEARTLPLSYARS